ncbi:MAG: SPOR domain-containing protein [Clostridiales bacterium]|nr:SPOR domain-containing protein [Clostridiales bacterium]
MTKYRPYRSKNRRGGAIRHHGRRNPVNRENSKIIGVNLTAIIAIIGVAVLLGFLTTKFFIYPLILGQEASFNTDFGTSLSSTLLNMKDSRINDTSGSAIDTVSEKTDNPVVNPESQDESVETDISYEGYSIQYGSFSTKEAAEKLLTELKSIGLTARIIENDGGYKVIGQIFDTMEEASSTKELVLKYAPEEYKDVFVTKLENTN